MRLSRRAATWARRVAVVVAVVGCVLLVLLGTVRATVLDGSFYEGSLDDAEAYDRFYTQVLADPEFDETVQRLVGSADNSVLTSNLRVVIPPATLRALVTRTIAEVIGYLTAERDTVTMAYAVAPLLDNVRDLAETYLTDAIVNTPSFQATSLDEFGRSVEGFVADVRAGRDPELLPTVQLDSATATSAIGILAAIAPADEQALLREQLEPLVRSGDLNGAFALSAQALIGEQGEVNAGILRVAAGRDGKVDFSASVEAADDSTVVQGLVLARMLLGDLFAIVLLSVVGIVALALGLVAFVTARLGGRPARAVGLVLVLGGAVAALGWIVVRSVTPDPLGPVLGPGNTAMAPAVQAVLRDAWAHGQDRIDVIAVTTALRVALVGGIVLLGAWLVPIARRAWDTDRTKFWAFAVAGVMAVVLFFTAEITIRIGADPGADLRCNGHVELCDRRYDEVAYFGSHNGMASADRRFISAMQDLTMSDQLEQGVRALLIDAHYWEAPEQVDELIAGLPPETADSLRPLVQGADPPRPGAWLCHVLCRLGAQPLHEGFAEIARFLEDHPREVVTIVLEDYVSRDDVRDAAKQAGLARLTFTPEDDPSFAWPTLGEMIDANERVVILAEKSEELDAPDWYRPYYRYGMETPYDHPGPEEMSCQENRGGSDKRLFLLNHWITRATGSRADSGVVNQEDFVLERARRCAKERGHRVNIVAVDFTTIGDVADAVDVLNGVRRRQGSEQAGR